MLEIGQWRKISTEGGEMISPPSLVLEQESFPFL
jgi:hypothetical protein